jgi:hypothetical protein
MLLKLFRDLLILRDDLGAAFLPRSHSLKHCLAISILNRRTQWTMTNTQTNESSVSAESDGGIEALWRGNPLSDIFISYAEEDREQARRLAEALKAQG